jgi:hypothetical protein
MTPLRGAAEVHRLRNRVNAVFARARSLREVDPEIQSDFARYLCVLVSGFVETAVAELAIEHCRNRAGPSVANFSTTQLDRIQNLNANKLIQLIGSFKKSWSSDLSSYIEGARKDALDSVLHLRNKIAHGESVSLSLARISQYFEKVDEIVVQIEKLLK